MEEGQPYEPYYPQSPLPITMMSDSLIQWQLQADEIVEEFIHKIRGEIYDYDKKRWNRYGKQLMNEKGISHFSTILHTIINKNIILSGFEDDDIRRMVVDIDADVCDIILFHGDEYEIDKSSRKLLVDLVESNVMGAFNRAKVGKDGIGATQRFLTTTQRYQETNVFREPGRGGSPPEPKAKTGLLNFFGRR